MAWIESHQSLLTHRKTARLARRLGVSKITAIGHLHALWWWAVDNTPGGDLSALEPEDIADGGCWEGEAAVFRDGLIYAGFVDADAGGQWLHNWDRYTGRLLDKRRAEAERLRAYRQRTKDDTPTAEPRTQIVQRTNVVTVPNRTSTGPDLTGPDPVIAQEIKPEIPVTPTVVVVPGRRAATTATAQGVSVVPLQEFSEGARSVLETWRGAHGKRSPPKLNPTQAAKLEAAVVDLGVARLEESARWSAEKGLGEFHKCLTAAYTKRRQEDAAEREPVMGRRNGHGSTGQPAARSPNPFAKFR